NSAGSAPDQTTSVALASLPAAVLPAWLDFDAVRDRISHDGAMADSRRGELNFSSDPAYQTAVDAIYDMRTLWGVEVVGGTPNPAISDHVNQILAALRISAQDLARIRARTGLVLLTYANLSNLCRHVFLAQGLGLSIADLLTMLVLTGVDPFQRGSAAP